MKLRIKGNSIRLRLTQGDVAKFNSDGKLVETVEFGNDANFYYELLKSETSESVSAAFENGKISVFVPKTQAETWANSEEICIESEKDAKIKIAVEKDFACLTPRQGEDESDNFPHPKGEKVC